MHTMFMREHNRIADALHLINPRWSEEAVFHQARRIVAAQTQHITFSEFLPRVLGPETVTKYNLALQPDGYYNGNIFNFSAISVPNRVDDLTK
jgi:peroxidase